MGKALHIAQAEGIALAADAKRGLSVAMGRVRGTRHGTGSGKRSGRRESKGQAYCMKRIKERAQR